MKNILKILLIVFIAGFVFEGFAQRNRAGMLRFHKAYVTKTALTMGVDDTGVDVKFFGATSGSYLLWDESADALLLKGTVIGLDMQGSYTNAAIDFTDVTLNHSGSSGPVMLRAGTYGSPVTSSDAGQSGMIRLYGRNSALTDDEASGFYDRGLFVTLKTTGAKGIFPIAGLAEVEATVSGNGPTSVMAGQFISHLLETGSKLANTTGVNGMYASWFKITAIDGASTGATSKKAVLGLDNQMSGNNDAPGEEYTIFATTGGLQPDAYIGFETSSSGWDNFLYFDETAFDQDPVVSATVDGGTQDRYLKVSLNGTAYAIALYTGW